MRLRKLPPEFLHTLLLRGLHDIHYSKADVDEDTWNNSKEMRSYDSLLQHFGADTALLDKPFNVEWVKVGLPASESNRITKTATIRQLLQSKINIEKTDRTTLIKESL